MPDLNDWISAVTASHQRLVAVLSDLDGAGAERQSYASEWTIADVASHLGSQAEIFGLFLAAGRAGEQAPDSEVFGPIWDRWNALSPTEQVSQSIAANSEFVQQLQQISEADTAGFSLSMFGRDFDLAGVLGMRLGEHAVHAWDIEVALNPAATLAPDAVQLLIDTVDQVAARSKPVEHVEPVAIDTGEPERHWLLTAYPAVNLAARTEPASAALQLPAEAFIRLVYGRLDPDHSPVEVVEDHRLVELRRVFPGLLSSQALAGI